MPLFNSTTLGRDLGTSTYGYSGTRLGDLGAAEYTLVSLVVDVSGSVHSYRQRLEQCMSEIAQACLRAPRADNLLLRTVTFDSSLDELHGFTPLTAIQPSRYLGALRIGGSTALYDAITNGVEAMGDYGRELADNGFAANGIVFVLTDGCDNASTLTARHVRDVVEAAVQGESLESVMTLLVGVDARGGGVSKQLMALSTQAGFDHYVELDKTDTATFARLARFVQQSVAAQSRALGSGTASRVLTF